MRIQAWPVHQTRPNLGVGLRRRIDGMKDVSSRAVSKDSQRLRDWTPDEPVDDLIKSIADSHKPFRDRQSSQFLSGRAFLSKPIADSTLAVSPLPSWGSLFWTAPGDM